MFIVNFRPLLNIFILFSIVCLTSCTKEAPEPKINADFTVTPGQSPGSVTFKSSSENATSFYWNFGDGTSGFGPEVTHNYTRNGNFTVTLTATGVLPSKFPTTSNQQQKEVSKPVTINNLPSVLSARIKTGGNESVFTASTITVTQNTSSNQTVIKGTSASGDILEIRVPSNVSANNYYIADQQTPLHSRAVITYTNPIGTFTTETSVCGTPYGFVSIMDITSNPNMMRGQFSAELTSCVNGYYSIYNADFTAYY